jgi:hypothetical protein
MQVAEAYANPALRGKFEIGGATFAALGVQPVVARMSLEARERGSTAWQDPVPHGLADFVAVRLLNYVREGDGIVLGRLDREGYDPHSPIPNPEREGQTRAETHKTHHTIAATRQTEAMKFLASLS